jgi:hypothetical protein
MNRTVQSNHDAATNSCSTSSTSSIPQEHHKNIDSDDDFMSLVEWELNKRRGRSATYTQPLLVLPHKEDESNEKRKKNHHTVSIEEEENIHSFLSEFYSYQIYEEMPNMKQILRLHPDTVAIHYGLLVPNSCSFDEFWSRYYYRCSIVQVKNDLIARKQRTGTYENSSSTNHDDDDDVLTDTRNNENHMDSQVTLATSSVDQGSLLSEKQQLQNPQVVSDSTNPATNRTLLFYQEYDRDIIEVIPEAEEDDSPLDNCEGHQH